MASWRPTQRGFGDGRGPGRGIGGRNHQQFPPQRGRGAGYYQQRHGATSGAMMSQPTAAAAGHMDHHGQASAGVQPPHYHGGGRGGHESDLSSSIAPETDNVSSPEAGSPPELSPRSCTIQVTADQLKCLSVQDESGTGQEIVQAFSMSSSSYKFPHRPGSGSIGTRCLVRANHFFAELPDKDLHQYDVCIGITFSVLS
jgi:eukaryotic translation initiation factor 2C